MDDRGVQPGKKILLHPHTGDPIVPIGFVGGKPVWPIIGASPDDDGADDGDDEDDDDDTGDSGDGDDADDDDDASGDDDKDGDERLKRAEARMKAADKRAAKAEAALKKIEDSKKDDLTKATDRVSELETTVTEQADMISGLRLENAFLSANKHNWHDPDTALSIARAKGYLDEVADEDGVIDTKKLGKALDSLARENAYLVKKAKSDDDDAGGGSSGESAGGRRKSKDKKAREQQLRTRFPSLNR